jgi:hypothetical protein
VAFTTGGNQLNYLVNIFSIVLNVAIIEKVFLPVDDAGIK